MRGQGSFRRVQAMQGALISSAWAPPQLASLVGAWVSGLSGAVGTGGTWLAQYGVTRNLTLGGNAVVGAGTGYAGDGSGDSASGAAATALYPGTGDMSYAMLVRTAGTAQQSCLTLGLNGNSFSYPGYLLHYYGDRCYTFLSNGAGTTVQASTSLGQTSWTHFVATHSRSGNLIIYKDGSSADSASLAALSGVNITDTVRQFRIGIRGDGTAYSFNGKLDCVYIWMGVVLSSAEVTDLYVNDPYKQVAGT